MKSVDWMGDSYIVCPVRMIVSGVLEGSEGALYYPPSEIEESVNSWNGMPIVINHPSLNGIPVSARNPLILESSSIGWVFNCNYNTESMSLDGEAWMSRKRLDYADNQLSPKDQILPKLQQSIPVEVSTGLGTINQPAENNNNIDPNTNKRFTHIARNYRPDHLAILPDKEGACSVNDGCGLRTNSISSNINNPPPSNSGANQMKPQLIKYLTTNCDCWKGEESTLNNFSEDKLKKLKNQIVDSKLTKFFLANGKNSITILTNSKKVTKNASGQTESAAGISYTDMADLFGVEADPASDPVGFVDALKAALQKELDRLGGSGIAPPMNDDLNPDDPNKDEPPVTMTSTTDDPTKNNDDPSSNPDTSTPPAKKDTMNNKRKPMTDQEWMATAPPNIRSTLLRNMKADEQRKKQFVDMIVNHQSQVEETRNIIRPVYEKMSIEELETLAATVPTFNGTVLSPGNVNGGFPGFGQPSFIGNGGAFLPQVANAISDKEEDLMPLPWDHK